MFAIIGKYGLIISSGSYLLRLRVSTEQRQSFVYLEIQHIQNHTQIHQLNSTNTRALWPEGFLTYTKKYFNRYTFRVAEIFDALKYVLLFILPSFPLYC